MNKTGNDVKANVYAITRFTDAKFDEELTASEAFIIAINEAIRQLADRGLLFASGEVAALTAHTYYELPGDCIVVLGVLTSAGTGYCNWHAIGNNIRFAEVGVYTVNYQPYPAEITALTEPLPYRDPYFTALCDYCKYWIYTFDDEESPVADKWYQKFLVDGQKTYEMLAKNKGPMQMAVRR